MVGNSCWCHCRQHEPLALLFQQSWWFAQIFGEYFQKLISYSKTFVFNSSSTIIGQTQIEIYLYIVLCSCVSVRQSSEESVIIIVVVVVAASAASSSSVACRGKDKVFARPPPQPLWDIHSNCFVFRGCTCCLFVCLKRWQQRGSDWLHRNMFKLLWHTESFYQHSFDSAPLSNPQNATNSSLADEKLTQ